MALKKRGGSILERWFPERNIYHRSGGTVKFITISPWQQVIMAAGATALAFWVVYGTLLFVLGVSPDKGLRQASLIEQYMASTDRAISLRDERIKLLQVEVIELRAALDGAVHGNLSIPEKAQTTIGDLHQVSIEQLYAELSTVRHANDKLQERLNKLDIKSLESIDNAYQYMKHALNTLEPENSYSANEQLDIFLKLVQSVLFGVSAALSMIIGIFVTKIVSKIVRPKISDGPDFARIDPE